VRTEQNRTGNWKLETGNWKLETGNLTGNWKLETANRKGFQNENQDRQGLYAATFVGTVRRTHET
jgi:hypothetical protein